MTTVNELVLSIVNVMSPAQQYDLAFKVAENIGYSLIKTPDLSDVPETSEEWFKTAKLKTKRELALERAALDFIHKVDRGEAKSVKSYAAFKAALGGTEGP